MRLLGEPNRDELSACHLAEKASPSGLQELSLGPLTGFLMVAWPGCPAGQCGAQYSQVKTGDLECVIGEARPSPMMFEYYRQLRWRHSAGRSVAVTPRMTSQPVGRLCRIRRSSGENRTKFYTIRDTESLPVAALVKIRQTD
jgi:hypothetical protein